MMVKRRNPAALLGWWAGAIILIGLIYWISRSAPAFEDLLTPIYWIIAIILVAATIKWFRTRSAIDRRGDDRRRTSRRDIE